MIIADATVWLGALENRVRGLEALLTDLRTKKEVTAPPAVFAEVLSEAPDERAAQLARTWALEVPPVNETNTAWLTAGDLGAHLRRQGMMISPMDLFLMALCLREGWVLWTLNSALLRLGPSLPVKLYEPAGLR